MGDGNYYPNYNNHFSALNTQNYSYSHYQQQLYNSDSRLPQSEGFTVNSSMPVYNTKTPSNQEHHLKMEPTLDAGRSSECEEKPPPSYEESHKDILLSRSKSNSSQATPWCDRRDTEKHSQPRSFSNYFDNPDQTKGAHQASDYMGEEDNSKKNMYSRYFDLPGQTKDTHQTPDFKTEEGEKNSQTKSFSRYFDLPGQKRDVNQPPYYSREEERNSQTKSFSRYFDIPGQTNDAQAPDWASDSYNPPPTYQANQGRFNPYDTFSQHSSATFSSGSRGQANSSFAYQNQRGFDRKNLHRGRGRGGFRGHGNRPNRGRPQASGSGQGHDRSQPANQSEYQDFAKDSNMAFSEHPQGSDGEEDEDNEHDAEVEKINAFDPDPMTVKKYEYFPPSVEEMGKMFKDLVIQFFYKRPRNKKERNLFVIICESFRRSLGYHGLQVEDGYDISDPIRKFCTLRYQGMMMARGVSENRCIKEARVRAGLDLINNLAMSCYTLESKVEYFSTSAFEKLKEQGSVPGVYIIVSKEEAHDFETARGYIQRVFSEQDSDVEYMFEIGGAQGNKLKWWAREQNPPFEARMVKDEWVGITRQRTAQYWRDKILASGSLETERYKLKPPQGIGRKLLKNFHIEEFVPQLKKCRTNTDSRLANVYGPPGVGPRISRAAPPWIRRTKKQSKDNRKKERKCIQALKEGVPLESFKAFRYMGKKHKRNVLSLKEKLGL